MAKITSEFESLLRMLTEVIKRLKFLAAPGLFILLFFATVISAGAEGEIADQDQQKKAGDVVTDVRIRSSIRIKAKQPMVWASIHEQRTDYSELEYARVLSNDGTTSVVEQRFMVSLLGKATCTFRETNSPPDEITYELLKSDMFSVMDGKWKLSAAPGDRGTRLDLYCHAGIQKPVPRFLLKIGLSRSLKRHLNAIKKTAEKKELLR